MFFVLVIIKQFNSGFRFVKLTAAAFTVMFAFLCFGRFDSLIVKYNMTYMSDSMKYSDIEEMAGLSADSAAEISSPEYRDMITEIIQNERGWTKEDDYYIYSDNGNFDWILSSKAGFDIYDKMNISSLIIRHNLEKR